MIFLKPLLVHSLLTFATTAGAQNTYPSDDCQSALPSLLDATAEELSQGLQARKFTCVNLVDVRNAFPHVCPARDDDLEEHGS